jgi:hypothetical protein
VKAVAIVPALYRGVRRDTGNVVSVERDGRLRPLIHRMQHSPTGLEWGYGGSGPADLARSILWDHLNYEPEGGLYQDFKWAFVARWQGNTWELTSQEIDAWLAARDVEAVP